MIWSSGILPITLRLRGGAGSGLLFPPSRNFRRAARAGDSRRRTDGREGGGRRPSSLSLSLGEIVAVLVVVVVVVFFGVAVVAVVVFDLGWESRG